MVKYDFNMLSGIQSICRNALATISSVKTVAIKQLKEAATSIVATLKNSPKTLNLSYSTIKRSIKQFVNNKRGKTIGDILEEKGLQINKEAWNDFPKDLKELLIKGEVNEKLLEDKKLGKGGSGSVYSIGGDKKYVIKISEHDSSYDDNTDKIGNELVMRRIKNRDVKGLYAEGVDFITKYYGSTKIKDEDGKEKYLSIFERADGVDGDRFLQSEQGKFLTLTQRLSIAKQLAKSIAALHSVGLVHQDIKPQNMQIYCDENNLKVKLIDFGTVGTKASSSDGTTLFNPGRDRVGLKKDVYAYGISMLFNFFPEHGKIIGVFFSIKHGQLIYTNEEEELKNLAKNELVKLKENEGWPTFDDKGSPISSVYFQTDSDIGKLIDYLNGTKGDTAKYEGEQISFLKNFFKQTIESDSPPSIVQISKALEVFEKSIPPETTLETLDDEKSISLETIFNDVQVENPKKVPAYLLNAVKNAHVKLEAKRDKFHLFGKGKAKAELEATQKEFETAKQELKDFKKQNGDYFENLSQDEKLLCEELGIMNQEECGECA